MDRAFFPAASLASRALRIYGAWTVIVLAFPVTLSAHHAMGGKLPASAVEGLLSGLSHPIIGLDHFFVILAAGILSARLPRGAWIPVAFVIASLLGTGLHVMRVDLAGAQVIVAGSVLCFGGALAIHRRGGLEALTAVALAAGIFHGYTYAESIVGAEPAPLVAYLAGFTAVQLAVAMLGRALVQSGPRWPLPFTVGRRALGAAMSLGGIVLLARALMTRG